MNKLRIRLILSLSLSGLTFSGILSCTKNQFQLKQGPTPSLLQVSQNSNSNGQTGGNFFSTPTPSPNPSPNPTPTPSPTPTGSQGLNIVPLSLGSGSINQVSVSVNICVPNTTNCRTVSNLLLDTGSTGVRIFSSALGSVYASLSRTGLANCTSYADNSYDWGPMVLADVGLGGAKAHSVPIQVIDSSYGDGGSACNAEIRSYDSSIGVTATPWADVQSSTFNGIVGVSFLAQDCGQYCVTNASSGSYFSCSGSSCNPSTAALNLQMTNPVTKLTTDNNGIAISFPAISGEGANSVQGSMILGIGTQANNTPAAGVKTLTANPNQNSGSFTMFTTNFQNNTIVGFIDSGSSCLAFPFSNSSLLPQNSYGEYAPSQPVNLSATQIGYNQVQSAISFTIAAPNNFPIQSKCGLNLGNSFASSDFDWGLPFFLGRTVYIGLEGTSSSLGSGLYWAY